jgi:hypothetical protein
MSIYPIIKLPRKIKQAYEAQPAAVFQPPAAPLEPLALKPPRRFNPELLGAEFLLLSMLSGGISIYLHWLTCLLLWVIGVALIFAQAIAMNGQYDQLWREHRDRMDRALRQQWEAEFERSRWERLQTPAGIAQYRRTKIAAHLAASSPARPISPATTPIDRQFAQTLTQYFSHKVHVDKGSGLMLIDQESGLHISIIIDRLPQAVAGIAAGSFIEDDLYLDRCWVVARFTSNQAHRAADSCCKALAEVCAELLQDNSWLPPFNQVPDLWALAEIEVASAI